nr:BolA family transcriptional regulator [Nitratireductor sp. B36]
MRLIGCSLQRNLLQPPSANLWSRLRNSPHSIDLVGARRHISIENTSGGTASMAMNAADIERLIKEGIPDAKVTIRDLAGDGDHYAAEVVAESFRGKSRVQQHQMVYNALKGNMGGALHALALQTSAPD